MATATDVKYAPSVSTCVTCRACPGSLAYVLIEHSPTRTGYDVICRVVEPYPLHVCSPCLARIHAWRRRTKIVAGVALGGIALACGYIVGGLFGAPTAVVLGMLFGGFGAFAVGVALMIAMQRFLVASLPIEANRGRNILLVTTDRNELERELDRLRLAFAEVRNELDRARSDAEPLPSARMIGGLSRPPR
jgi:hypothetical protein